METLEIYEKIRKWVWYKVVGDINRHWNEGGRVYFEGTRVLKHVRNDIFQRCKKQFDVASVGFY